MAFGGFGGVGDFAWSGAAGDTTPPELAGDPVVDSSGTFIDFTFVEPMDTGSTPAGGDMDFDASTQATIASFAWQSSTVLRATLATHRVMSSTYETVLIDYTPGVNPIRDAAGNNLAALNNQAVTNNSIHAPMLWMITLWSGSGNYTTPADLHGTSITVELWGGGKAGVINTSGGAGGYYAQKTDTVAANTAYAYVIGDGGVAPNGNGVDSTWRSTVCVAPGGGSATSPVGDVTRAGGAGGSAVGNNNGGGTAGTTSNASVQAAGEPNGTPGNSLQTPRVPGTGGGSRTTTIEHDGARGLARLTMFRAPPISGPYCVAAAEYRDTVNTASRDLAAPGSHAAGDEIILLAGFRGAAAPSSSDATEVLESGNAACTVASYARAATGSDTIALASTTTRGCFWSLRFRGGSGVSGVESGGAAVGSTSSPTPTSFSPSGGSVARIAIAWSAMDTTTSSNNSPTSIQANYEGAYTPAQNHSNAIAIIWGQRLETASSYNPGSVGGTLNAWSAQVTTVE